MKRKYFFKNKRKKLFSCKINKFVFIKSRFKIFWIVLMKNHQNWKFVFLCDKIENIGKFKIKINNEITKIGKILLI